MGYTHYWRQRRPFTLTEWVKITAEAKRICAKAQKALYAGKEDYISSTGQEYTEFGFRVGFKEEYAWRTFAHTDRPTAMQGAGIELAGPDGTGQPEFTDAEIALNGKAPDDYESFVLERAPVIQSWQRPDPEGIFNFCKTEYRAYDPVVVSILAAARTIAPDAIKVTSDGGDEAIKLMF